MCGFDDPLRQIISIGVNLDKKSGGALTMASAEHEPITGSGGRAPSRVQGSGGHGAKRPVKLHESFLRIGHTNKGDNWPHVRVLNERNCNLGKRSLIMEGKGTTWGAPEAGFERNWWSDCRECHFESFIVWCTTEDSFIIGVVFWMHRPRTVMSR